MKTAEQILAAIQSETSDLTQIKNALEDGVYLLSIGVTYEDQDAVECAHAIVLGQIHDTV